jgi:hypothetical protein
MNVATDRATFAHVALLAPAAGVEMILFRVRVETSARVLRERPRRLHLSETSGQPYRRGVRDFAQLALLSGWRFPANAPYVSAARTATSGRRPLQQSRFVAAERSSGMCGSRSPMIRSRLHNRSGSTISPKPRTSARGRGIGEHIKNLSRGGTRPGSTRKSLPTSNGSGLHFSPQFSVSRSSVQETQNCEGNQHRRPSS